MADTSTGRRSHAEILFGDPPSNTVPIPAPADTSPRRSNADVLFGEKATTTTPVARPTTPERKSRAQVLFPDAEVGLDLEDNMRRIADVEGLTTAQQAEELREFATVAIHDLGLERHEARRLHEVYTKRRLEGGADDWDAHTQHWATASRRALRDRYGAAEADSLVTALDAYAKTHPGLEKILEGGVGAHPDVVAMFAEHVRRVGR